MLKNNGGRVETLRGNPHQPMTRQERGERLVLGIMSLLWFVVLAVLIQQHQALDRLHQRADRSQLQNEALQKELTDRRLNDLIRDGCR